MPGAVVALVVFSALNLFIKEPISIPNGEVILTVATFLFAIIAGFYIARLGSRYDAIRSLVAQEDANFLALYQTSRAYGRKFSDSLRELIDRYYVMAYDSLLATYEYKRTAPEFLLMWKHVVGNKATKDGNAGQVLLNQLTQIENSRNGAATIASERLHASQWSVLVMLTIIILIGLYGLDLSEPFVRAVVILLSTAIVLILLILRDLQNLMLGGTALLEESGQEVLESIGKPRYYNARFLKIGVSKIPGRVTEYRLGRHAPGAEKTDIVMVRRKGKR